MHSPHIVLTLSRFIDALRLLPDADNFSHWMAETSDISGVVRVMNSFATGWQTNGLLGVFKAGGRFFTSLIKAHPILTALAGAMALDKFVFTMDDKLENAQEAIQNYQSTQQEIEGVNNELATTQSRMNELLAKDSLTLVEKDELSKLL